MTSEPTLFDDPQVHARTDDPETSHQAARAARYQDAWLILEQYAAADRLGFPHGLTDHQAYDLAAIGQRGHGQRCSDLRRKGWIADSGQPGKSPFGRPAMRCQITDEGRQALAARQGVTL